MCRHTIGGLLFPFSRLKLEIREDNVVPPEFGSLHLTSFPNFGLEQIFYLLGYSYELSNVLILLYIV